MSEEVSLSELIKKYETNKEQFQNLKREKCRLQQEIANRLKIHLKSKASKSMRKKSKPEIKRIEFFCTQCDYTFLRTYPVQETWGKYLNTVWNEKPSSKRKEAKQPFVQVPLCPKCKDLEVIIAKSEIIRENEL